MMTDTGLNPNLLAALDLYAAASDASLKGLPVGSERAVVSLAAASFMFAAALVEAAAQLKMGAISEVTLTSAQNAVLAAAESVSRRMGKGESLDLAARMVSVGMRELAVASVECINGQDR